MLIELIGLSGAGKSTFARSLCEEGIYTRIRISSKRELFFYNFVFLFLHPMLFFRLLALVVRYKGPVYLWKFKFVSVFLDYNAKYIKAKRGKQVILDQGHTQLFFSLFEHVLSQDKISRILHFLPKADQYIVFDVDENVRAERLKKRPYAGRKDLMPAEDFAQWQKTVEELFPAVTEVLEKGDEPVYKMSTNEDKIQKFFTKKDPIYYVHSSRIPTEKAYGNQVSVMCQAFANMGHRVEVWSPTRFNTVTSSLFEYYDIPKVFSHRTINCPEFAFLRRFFKRIAFYLDQAFFLYSLFKTKLPENAIVYVRRPEVGWIFIRKGNRVVYECHEWMGRHAWFRLWLLKGVSRIVTTNKFIKEKFTEHNINPDLFVVAPNGVAYDIFAIDDSKDEATEKLRKNNILFPDVSDASILLYTGNFKTMGEDKGISDILHSLQYIKDKKVQFVAVGGTQEYIDEYTEMAEKLGVADRSSFFPRVSKDDLALFQRSADIMLMPFPRKAHYEYFMSPLKIFEYMASGRPILATDLPSILEILNEKSAFFCNPDDPKDIAKEIEYMLNNKAELETRSACAQNDVVQYTWSNRASVVLADLAT